MILKRLKKKKILLHPSFLSYQIRFSFSPFLDKNERGESILRWDSQLGTVSWSPTCKPDFVYLTEEKAFREKPLPGF